MEKRVCLITGASRGIGKSIIDSLIDYKGHLVVIGTATTDSGVDSINLHIKSLGLEGKGLKLDVLSEDSIDQMFSYLTENKLKPDILINNAGITRDNLILRMSKLQWDQVMMANCNFVFRICQFASKHMLKKRWGRIVNISSVVALTGNAGQANYTSSKAAVIAFTKSIAQELASRNITANCVCPGFIDTDMSRILTDDQKKAILSKIPMSRMGDPKEVAYAVSVLLDERSSYITGSTIHVNGGLVML